MIRKSLAFLTLALSASFASATPVTNSYSFTGKENKNAAKVIESDSAYRNGVLVDFTLSYTGTFATNAFAVLWFNNHNGAQIGLKANCGAACAAGSDLFIRPEKTTGDIFFDDSNIEPAADKKSAHLYAYLYKSSDSYNYDRMSAWFDPEEGELKDLTNGHLTLEHDFGFSSFDTIGFRTQNLQGATVTISGLNINEVPEPGSVALMGLALAGLMAARRRRG